MLGRYNLEFDKVLKSDVLVMPGSDGRRFAAGVRLLRWRSCHDSWLPCLLRHIGDCVWLEVEYPDSGVALEIVPTSVFAADVEKGVYRFA